MIKLIGINPLADLANQPEIWVETDKLEKLDEQVYTKSGSIYWYQMENGLTSFCTHPYAPVLNAEKTLYVTDNARGYGGASFTIKVNNFDKPVRLRGPWSSNSEYANKILPKPVCNVTVVFNKQSNAGSLTLEALEPLLSGTQWIIELHNTKPVLLYKGLFKEELHADILKKLQMSFNLKLKGVLVTK